LARHSISARVACDLGRHRASVEWVAVSIGDDAPIDGVLVAAVMNGLQMPIIVRSGVED